MNTAALKASDGVERNRVKFGGAVFVRLAHNKRDIQATGSAFDSVVTRHSEVLGARRGWVINPAFRGLVAILFYEVEFILPLA